MRNIQLYWRLNIILALLLLALAPHAGALQTSTTAHAQAEEPEGAGPVVRSSENHDTSPALRDMELKPPISGEFREIPLGRFPHELPGVADDSLHPRDQSRPAVPTIPDPIADFEGTANVNALYPPDTNGDIGYDPESGTSYYVQMVNTSFQIWDVTDPEAPVSLIGPVDNNTLWDGFGGPCETTNDGDPIVLFDHLDNRWLMSQFALPSFPLGPFYECIAISQTADPTGSWYRYAFLISDTKMDDYPKFGVWPDAYYMSVNQFNEGVLNYAGVGAVAFERDAMLVGDPATMVYFDVGAVTLDYFAMLPSDLDGPPPPAGTPNYFVAWDDGVFLPPVDALRVWEFHVDFDTPANSTFGANASFDPNTTIPTDDVDYDLCGFDLCVPQPDPGGQLLDSLSYRLMFRLQYRDFGDYQVMLSNNTVDADGTDRAGVHWFELRDTGSGWEIYQENVFAPADDLHRWMGSIAMDGSGNIALGYSVSSDTVSPSIYYTGRLAGDPLDTLPQGEAILTTGSGYQTGPDGRWGDYSNMAVDPTDDCTFWYTQEYVDSVGFASWQTRVASFAFPECTGAPVAEADLAITKDADLDTVSPEQELTYTLTVFNAGPDAADNVTVEDTLPDGVTLVSVSSSQGGCVSLPCNLGTIAASSDATVTVVVTVGVDGENPLVNTAVVSSVTDDPSPDDNTATLETVVIHHIYFPLVIKNFSAP